MLKLIFGILGSLLGPLLGRLFGKKPPDTADLAASNATAQAQLTQEHAAHEIVDQASAARAAADARILHEQQDGPNRVDAGDDNPLNRDADAHFRD